MPNVCVAEAFKKTGKQRRVPTEAGQQLGLYTESHQGQYGTYETVLYSPDAQRFLLEPGST